MSSIDLAARWRRAAYLAAWAWLLCGASPSAAQLASEPAADGRVVVSVTVEGAESEEGRLLLALFDSPDRFTDAPFATAVLEVQAGGAVWSLEVPPGVYAAAAIHDLDGNGELNKNFLGMPREPYGFSNDARGRTGPPSFDDARFEVDRAPVAVRVRVRD